MDSITQPASTGEAHDNDDADVDDTAGGITLLEANPGRLSALIINTGGSSMRVTTDGTAPTSTRGKLVPAGAALGMDGPNCATAEVKAICDEGESTTANASEVD